MASVVKTLATYNSANVVGPAIDTSGNLFYAVDGTVYEISYSASGYSGTPLTVANFGSDNVSSLLLDVNGDLFGTTNSGGTNGYGTLFEIAKSPSGYSSTPTTLVNFTSTNPSSTLIRDAAGDVFGTTSTGGAYGDGTIFEFVAGAPVVLASLNAADATALGSVAAVDANGDLFGTTSSGGAGGYGSVFEIARSGSNYSDPVNLVSFDGADGETPSGALIVDASGDLFGTTTSGGANSAGTLFEIAKTGAGYASSPTVLAAGPTGFEVAQLGNGLAADSAGDLYATSIASSLAFTDISVYELTKTTTGYSTEFTDVGSLASFQRTFETGSVGGLIAGPNGSLISAVSFTYRVLPSETYTTDSTIEQMIFGSLPTIAGSKATQSILSNETIRPFAKVKIADANADQTETVTISFSYPYNGALFNLDGGTYDAQTGVYTVSGSAKAVTTAVEGLYFAPAQGEVSPGQSVTTHFSIGVVDSDGFSASDSTNLVVTATSAQPKALLIVHANDLAHSSTAHGANQFIDLLNFEASYSDLIGSFGLNEVGMQQWYNTYEPVENRKETFDGLDYVASYADLTKDFRAAGSMQAVQDDGAEHFIAYGSNEGRSTSFNGLDYIASYSDLVEALGANNDAGAYQYIEFGRAEGRTTSFDGLDYIASYSDLIKSLGANEQAGAVNFIDVGFYQGRTTTFDGLAYIAQYADLMKAFGANSDAGATHYIDFGFSEGRSTSFDVAAYESAHPDLAGKFATNDAFLTAYINYFNASGKFLT